ncbi:hypothetical protein J25TS1_19030 [Bacillus paralicheniformis]|nr:hypothetical protein J25TS1_19030 [Bacillus paralicheniformis]
MGHYFIINDIYQKGYRTFISAIIMGDSNSGNIGICSSGSDRLLDESVWREAGFSCKPLIFNPAGLLFKPR